MILKALYFAIAVFSCAAFAQLNPVDPQKPVEKKMANFKKEIDAPRVGKLRLDYVYDEDNEPVSQPMSFKVFVTCDWRRKEILLDDIRGCELKSYNYAKEEKVLHYDFIYAVVDDGSIARCEKREERQIDLAKFCDDLFKKERLSKKPNKAEKI
jgi:hypothetical protein